MNRDAIGVFDSGIGGLTAVAALNRLLPNEDVIYFGDTARLPYGGRSRETVLRYAKEDVAFLRKFPVKMILAACGTVSSVVGAHPLTEDIPFTGVLLPTAQAACARSRNGKIGVIGTSATVRSGSYAKAIRTIRPSAQIFGQACPLFVPLVENGYVERENPVTKLLVEEYLTPLRNEGVDTLILGCTHYPLLWDIIADFMGEHVALISASEETAEYVSGLLLAKDLLTDRQEPGSNTYYVSDSVALFEENAKRFMHREVHGHVFCEGPTVSA